MTMTTTTLCPQTPDYWNSKAYKDAASFVPALATRVLQYLGPSPTDTILDIGCGDGLLTAFLASRCRHVIGIDSSPSMIASARTTITPEHGNIDFVVADCRRVSSDACETESVEILRALREGHYDAVFSNAAMHWILRDEYNRVDFFSDVFDLLKPGGRFAFEMGGHGNVAEAHATLVSVLNLRFGISLERLRQADPWFFPSTKWMRGVLQKAGFRVEVLELEDRPTLCTKRAGDGSGGLEGWLRLMGANFLALLEDDKQRDEAVALICEILRDVVTKVEDGTQWLGYKRLRVLAHKPEKRMSFTKSRSIEEAPRRSSWAF